MIKDREDEINRFEPKEYWNLEIEAVNQNKDKLTVQFSQDERGSKELSSETDVNRVLALINKKKLIVTQVKQSEKRRNPFEPFTTSTLQQEASNRLGFATRKTMMIAQQLYEGIDINKEGTVGLITYLRTDSVRISEEAHLKAQNYIEAQYGKQYLSPDKMIAKKNQKKNNAQDAHEAIRPTEIGRTPESIKSNLSNDQYKLYKLIWERLVASRMKAALYNNVTVLLEAGKCIFKANGSQLVFDGFLKVYSYASVSKDQILPELKEGDSFSQKKITPTQHFTQPPARYTEASLVKEMEELGIGRPSTYSPTISTILSRGYVVRESKSLRPTELGILVTRLLEDYFDKIIDVNFTASMEQKLDEIEDGEENWKQLLRDFYGPFREMLQHAEEHVEEVDLVEESDETCEKCGAPMLIKYGRYGKFLACSRYPECNNTKPFVNKIGVPCPLCHDGEVVERKSKKGRLFYGCNRFPDCRFVSWNQPVKEKCPACGSVLVIKKKQERY
jgi:DNA topoisomerase I